MVEHGVHAWDLGALIPIVEEAGGTYTDLPTPGHTRSGLFTNPALHQQILDLTIHNY
jgi:histidinol-phosphatase